jgi:hypothetical protein
MKAVSGIQRPRDLPKSMSASTMTSKPRTTVTPDIVGVATVHSDVWCTDSNKDGLGNDAQSCQGHRRPTQSDGCNHDQRLDLAVGWHVAGRAASMVAHE